MHTPSVANQNENASTGFRWGRTSGVIVLFCATLLMVGCAPTGPVAVEPSSNEVVDDFVPPVLLPGAPATENEPYFTHVLTEFSSSEAPVQGAPLVDALTAAGFSRAEMQVSFDQSRTGLVADSLLISVRIGEECLIGQVVTADRSVTTTVAPALTDARNVCLIGNTRPIDW